MTTTQVRRYALDPEQVEDFCRWWATTIPELRAHFGMAVPWAYLDEAASEFIWAVSVPGDRDDFDRIEAEYMASPERAAAFDGVPRRFTSTEVGVVRRIW